LLERVGFLFEDHQGHEFIGSDILQAKRESQFERGPELERTL